MEKIWNNAKFIYTEYRNYFDASKNPWGSRVPYVNQHCEIVDNNGLPMFWSDFDIVSDEKTELIFGNDEMKPGWTNYNKRAFYYVYDVSKYIHEGKNRILAVVSTGWYSGRIVQSTYGANPPAFIANIVHGGKSILVTD